MVTVSQSQPSAETGPVARPGPEAERTAAERPVRVQLSRAKGWRMPPNTVKVDRSTRWGNPFVVSHPCAGQWDVCRYRPFQWLDGGVASERRAREVAVAAYRDLIAEAPLTELRGKNLACWCPLHRDGENVPCHADVLLELANADAPPSEELGATALSLGRDEP